MSVTNAISSASSPVVCAPDPLPQSWAQFVQLSPISHVRSPHTGPPPLEEPVEEELLDEELLDELLEDEDTSPELEAMPVLEEDAPLPLEVCPLEVCPPEVVPVVVTGLPPAPPAPPRFSSSEPSVTSLMVPVQALRAMARAEMANRMRLCMIGDCTVLGIPVVTEKRGFAFK
jgi:hypothetical protein